MCCEVINRNRVSGKINQDCNRRWSDHILFPVHKIFPPTVLPYYIVKEGRKEHPACNSKKGGWLLKHVIEEKIQRTRRQGRRCKQLLEDPQQKEKILEFENGPGSSVGIATTGWMVQDRIPVGTRFSAHPDRPWGPPSLLYNGYRVFPGCKVQPGRASDHSPLLVLRSRKSRAILLPTLWAT